MSIEDDLMVRISSTGMDGGNKKNENKLPEASHNYRTEIKGLVRNFC